MKGLTVSKTFHYVSFSWFLSYLFIFIESAESATTDDGNEGTTGSLTHGTTGSLTHESTSGKTSEMNMATGSGTTAQHKETKVFKNYLL